MSPEEEKTAKAALQSIPRCAGFAGSLERLGGLTNQVYRAGPYVLRLPGRGTADYINRSHEAVSAHVAAAAGVSPVVIHADSGTGIMVTEYLDGTTTMSPDLFRTRTHAPARAGLALRKLHSSGGSFPFRFELFAMIDDYLGILATKDVAVPDGYAEVVRSAGVIRQALAAAPTPLVPCHCDPLCENFLDDGTRMWIVDWEYSGMNDPMWDLGNLSVEAGFDEGQDREMLGAYFGGPPSPADHGRMVIYKAMCDLLWTLWGLIQHANQNPADDFLAYAGNRFNRCRALMATAEFARHLEAVQARRTA